MHAILTWGKVLRNQTMPFKMRYEHTSLEKSVLFCVFFPITTAFISEAALPPETALTPRSRGNARRGRPQPGPGPSPAPGEVAGAENRWVPVAGAGWAIFPRGPSPRAPGLVVVGAFSPLPPPPKAAVAPPAWLERLGAVWWQPPWPYLLLRKKLLLARVFLVHVVCSPVRATCFLGGGANRQETFGRGERRGLCTARSWQESRCEGVCKRWGTFPLGRSALPVCLFREKLENKLFSELAYSAGEANRNLRRGTAV